MDSQARMRERRHHPHPAQREETWGEAVRDFLRRVYVKADQDGIFFMAGAIAFNLIVAIVPLLLAILGMAGVVLQNRVEDRPVCSPTICLKRCPPQARSSGHLSKMKLLVGCSAEAVASWASA